MAAECRVHQLNLGFLIHLPHPLVGVGELQFVTDLVANLGKGPHGDFLGAQQVEAVRLLQRLADLALLQREHRGAEAVGDVVAVVQGREIAVFSARCLVLGVLLRQLDEVRPTLDGGQ